MKHSTVLENVPEVEPEGTDAFPNSPGAMLAPRRFVSEVVAPLEKIAAYSPNLIANPALCFEADGQTHRLPSYVFVGPKGGGEPIRLGIFAGMHGDEPEGVRALVQFLGLLERKPELATGYCLFAYPVCNPTGFQNNTRHAHSGRDLNREFWRQSSEPEVKFLEAELAAHAFQGLISLHTDDTSDGFYGYAHGATLTEALIEPALQAAEQVLARNRNDVIDGFQARNGIIRQGYEGALRAPPNARPRPFEITLETPQSPPMYLKEAAFVMALQTILTQYRNLVAYAANL